MSRITTRLRRFLFVKLLVMIGTVALLQACGGGGGGSETPPPPPVIASPGYFDNVSTLGGADVYSDTANTIPLHIGDLQAMVNGNKLSLVSVTNNLAYYATFTGLTGNNYTANVSIYKDNIPYGNTTLSGTLVAGTSLTGTFATTGTGFGNGTFKLDYSLANSSVAAISRIVRDNSTVPANWRNIVIVASFSTFQIDSTGVLHNALPAGSGNFAGCDINGSVTTIPSTALYQVSMTLTNCTTNTITNGAYTGLATSRTESATDDRLVVAVTNGVYSMNGEFQ
jgi:hypothetical protein